VKWWCADSPTVTQLQEIRYEMKPLRVSEKTLQTEL
jgi:hypothetical protein